MMSVRIGIIIQARLGSSRLPKKILKSFSDSNLLYFQIQRLQKLNIPIVVATTTNPIDEELVNYLIEKNILYFKGDENNVLRRYIDTAENFKFDTIIRVCSDSPFIDYNYIKDLVHLYSECQNVDYFSYSFKSKPTVLSSFGIFAEIVTLEALKKVDSQFQKQEYCEHVTFGVYSNPNTFNINLIPLDKELNKFEKLRLTVDTEIDYFNILQVEKIFAMNKNVDFVSLANQIIENQSLVKSMMMESNRNKK